MSNEYFEIFLDSVDKFMKKELAPGISERDLFPSKPFTFDLYEKLKEVGILKITDMENDISNLKNIIKLLIKISEHCAGIGAYITYCLAGELFKKHISADIPSGIFPFCIFEDIEFDLADTHIKFNTYYQKGRLNGKKRSVMLAPHKGIFAAFATAKDENIVAWIPSDDKDILIEEVGLMGVRVARCADVSFKNVKPITTMKLDHDHLTYIISILSILTAACACGTAHEALEQAMIYAKDRYQGGHMIREYDAIKLLYMENRVSVDLAIDSLNICAEQFNPEDINSYIRCLHSKVSATKAALNATLDAIQIFGGYGYMQDYSIEKRFRDTCSLSVLPFDNTRALLMSTAL